MLYFLLVVVVVFNLDDLVPVVSGNTALGLLPVGDPLGGETN